MTIEAKRHRVPLTNKWPLVNPRISSMFITLFPLIGTSGVTAIPPTAKTTVSGFISLIKEYHDNIHSKIFFIGRGLNKSVRNFTSSRFKQLNINVCSMDDWRFRKENDLLIAISGSGKSSSVIDAVNIGKESFMKIASITSSSDSKLSSISDIILNVSGRSESISPDHHSLVKPAIYLPVFEYTAALLLDACVAQIAIDFGLTGEDY